MICYHHNDLDGRCAAAIVLKRYPNCRMREINYSDNPVFLEEVKENEIVFIVDFSFIPEKMNELFQLTINVIWIDHHKTAKDYGYDLDGLRDFTGKNSGCELTWECLFPDESMPEAVRLLGDYDCWRFDTKEKTIAFQLGLHVEITTPDSEIWARLLTSDTWTLANIHNKGCVILSYKDKVSERRLTKGYSVTFEGFKCFVINGSVINSSAFELLKNKNDYDFFISWIFDGYNYIVSMRSQKEIDVGEIAKKYGGGGHKGAAGFVCEKLPFNCHSGHK